MIIIARNYGQLGNRLFLYGHFIAAAEEYGIELANPNFSEYAHLFPATASNLWCRYPNLRTVCSSPRPWQRAALSKAVYAGTKTLSIAGLNQYPFRVIRIRGEETCDLGGNEFADAARGKRHILASGWLFRSEHLFQKHASVVRQHFALPETNQNSVARLLAGLRKDSDIVVGIHIRHGDYASFMNGRYFYSLQQYATIMRRIVEQLPGQRIKFLVCSNAVWEPSVFAGLDITPGTGHITEDMYALAETDLIFGPPSTYTGWASFYGVKPVTFLETADESFDTNLLLRHTDSAAA
ncbi:hypothetical protein N9B79_00530 [bacterium]|nr:hypothetical protein [Rubripirellula sp.]MDA7936839.1 hypothetical protein [bacterium]MDB4624895.1 hypothetical protein [Rubripirellula sp.]